MFGRFFNIKSIFLMEFQVNYLGKTLLVLSCVGLISCSAVPVVTQQTPPTGATSQAIPSATTKSLVCVVHPGDQAHGQEKYPGSGAEIGQRVEKAVQQAGWQTVAIKGDAGQFVDSNGTVSRWSDQSGNGRDAVQAVASRRPLYVSSAINSQAALRFSSGGMQVPSLPLNTYITVFTAGQFTNNQQIAIQHIKQQLSWETFTTGIVEEIWPETP
jgi:hypothetical protein